MENIYLKEMLESDIEILREYNYDFEKNNNSLWLSDVRFSNMINKWEKEQLDDSKVHFHPFWLMKDNKVVGQAIIKTNIEVDEMWKNYGGHISYEITPSNRKKGYGTICLHLALQKCMELGLKDILISCDIRNYGSKKIIENNYGQLKDCIVINNDDSQYGNIEYRYIINISDSLTKYKSNIPIIKPTLNQICNINRKTLSSFLINHRQNAVGNYINSFYNKIGEIRELKEISKLYKEFMNEFSFDLEGKYIEFERGTDEIAESKKYTGSNDVGLVLSAVLRMNDIPSVLVSSSKINDKNEMQSYTFIEIFMNDKWYLFDSLNGIIYDNYDYNNLSLPNGYYAFKKTLSVQNFDGCNLERYKKIMYDAFKDFDFNNYKEPSYKIINLKELEKNIINN